MARRRVTYLEGGARPRPADRTEVALGPAPPPVPAAAPASSTPRRPRWPVLAGAAGVVLAWSLWPGGHPAPPAVPEPPAELVPALLPGSGALDVTVYAPEPWQGWLERRPDARASAQVPRVHVLALEGSDGTAAGYAVVDATWRAFPGAGLAPGPRQRPLRTLGPPEGRGLRTLQWDEAGYGISLTTVGLTPEEQRRLAIALDVPGGPSLTSGRIPSFDVDRTARLGLVVTGLRSGAGAPTGGPLPGRGGGAAVVGAVHDDAGRWVDIVLVHEPVVSAAVVRRSLAVEGGAAPASVRGAVDVAVVAHDGPVTPEGARRGWRRVLVDLPGDVTAEVSSDALTGRELLALARSLDLVRLARAVPPAG